MTPPHTHITLPYYESINLPTPRSTILQLYLPKDLSIYWNISVTTYRRAELPFIDISTYEPINLPTCHCINQSILRSINVLLYLPINIPTHQWAYQSINPPIRQWAYQSICQAPYRFIIYRPTNLPPNPPICQSFGVTIYPAIHLPI